MRSLKEINNRIRKIIMLITNIRRTDTLLLFIFMCFIVKMDLVLCKVIDLSLNGMAEATGISAIYISMA